VKAITKTGRNAVTSVHSPNAGRYFAHSLGRTALYVPLAGLSIMFALPLVWAVSTSLKPVPQIYRIPPEWVPKPFIWRNYVDAMIYVPFLRYIGNTLQIAIPSTIGAVLSSAIVAYGFSRWNWPMRDLFFLICIATMMIPYQVTMVPLFIIFTKVHWINTYLPMIVPSFFGSPYYIFLLRQFFLTIPRELSDAAEVDGCTEWQTMLRIVFPLSVPALATVAIFSFMWSWNDYIRPLLYLKNPDLFTVSIGLSRYQAGGYTQPRWSLLMAASMTTILPMLVLFFFAQRTFIEGITMTGIKG